VPNASSLKRHPSLIALGEAIRTKRKERGISQEKLALLAEVDRGYLGRVERGENNVATLTLLKVANALNVDLADLIKFAGL
jgi:transcriptional regulator with XRE-family HTH domain